MTITLKNVTIADLTTLQQISRDTFSATFGAENSPTDLAEYLQTAYSLPQLTREVTNPDTDFQFIYVNDQLAGYLKTNVGTAQSELQDPTSLEVERIYIQKDFQRLGLGRRLINTACSRAHALNKAYIWLGVWEHNDSAQAFYQWLGFIPFSSHVFQLGASPQRDILLKKNL